jgi:hypothetical protein
MSNQGAVVSKLEQNPGTSEPGADPVSASKPYVPSRTRRFFIELEIGVKKTTSSPGRSVGLRPQQETSVVQPVLAFGAGAPKPPVPALDAAAALPGDPGLLAGAGSGSSISSTSLVAKLSVGETVTPPDGGGGIPP